MKESGCRLSAAELEGYGIRLIAGSEEVLICGGKRGPCSQYHEGKRGSTADNGSEWICCNKTAASVMAYGTRNIAIVGDMMRLIIFGNLAIRNLDCRRGWNFRFPVVAIHMY